MEISGTELQAIWIALKSAAAAYSVGTTSRSASGPVLSAARQRQDAQFAFVAKSLADQIERTKKVELCPNNFEIVVASLRLSARRWFDESHRATSKHDKDKNLAFSLSYDSLANRIAAAAGKAIAQQSLSNNH